MPFQFKNIELRKHGERQAIKTSHDWKGVSDVLTAVKTRYRVDFKSARQESRIMPDKDNADLMTYNLEDATLTFERHYKPFTKPRKQHDLF